MSNRKIGFVVVAILALVNALNAFDVIAIGWLIWPVAIATLIAALVVVTTPVEESQQNG